MVKSQDLEDLKKNLYSKDWKTTLNAADKLAELNTFSAISILIEGIKSDDSRIRNASALGIRGAKNELAHIALWNRIIELGPNEEIGTLVYSMETADCSNYLVELFNINIKGNFEVKNSTLTIMSEQTFKLNNEELTKIERILKKHSKKFGELKLKFSIINEA